MYFVVFIFDSGSHHIIPTTWVKDMEENWQKFINRGLNSSQKFTVYFSNRDEAMIHDQPDMNYEPVFTNEAKVFPQEGCYYAKILKYFGKIYFSFKYNFKFSKVLLNNEYKFYFSLDKYEDAQQYKSKRRDLPPAIYNENRLKEKPVPIDALEVTGDDFNVNENNDIDDEQQG